MRRPFRWDKKYLYWGVTAFIVIAADILFYMALRYIPAISSSSKVILRVFSPFVWGLAITYLLCPLMHRVENAWFLPLARRLYRRNKKNDGSRFARSLSVAFAILVLLLAVAALVWMIIPQIYANVENIIVNYKVYLNNITGWFAKLLKDYPGVEAIIAERVGDINEVINNWLINSVQPKLGQIMSALSSGVASAFSVVYHAIIGIILSVYLLSKIERVKAGFKRMLYCIFTVDAAAKISDIIRFADKTFMGFLGGKIVDSFIIGIICYIACAILKIPYALLVSVIIGITNIIPVFGPFIGAVPSSILIFMVSPRRCLVFVIMILILQQIDGHIIGPKILSNSVGVSGFWVLFAILVGGGLFGFWGMLLGVPIFVLLHTAIDNSMKRKLRRSGLPEEAADYKNITNINPITRQSE